jgi:hypothetical protein
MTTVTDRYQIEIAGNLDTLGTTSADAIVKTAQAVKRLERSLKDVEASVAGLNKINRALSRLLTTTDGAAERISAATRALQRLARVTASADATMGKAAKKIRDAAAASAKLETETTQAAAAQTNLDRRAEGAANALQRVDRAADGAGSQLASIGRITAGNIAALVTFGTATAALRTSFELLRNGVNAYAETSEAGAAAQAKMQQTTQELNAAIGQGVVESRAFASVQSLLTEAVRQSDSITIAFRGTLDALLLIAENVSTAFFGLAGRVNESGRAMTQGEQQADALSQSIRGISLLAIDAAIAIQAMIGAIGLLPEAVQLLNPIPYIEGALGGAGALSEFNEQLSEGRGRLTELRALRNQMERDLARSMSGPTFADELLSDFTAQVEEARRQLAESRASGGQSDAPVQPGRQTSRAEVAPDAFNFDADPELDAYIRATQAAAEKANEAIKVEAEARQQAIRDDARLRIDGQKRQLAAELAAQEEALRSQQELTEAARQRELEAVRAHGERMISLQREIVGQTAGVSADLITAGFTSAFDESAEKFGKAASKIIGQQLVTLGSSAITAGALAFVGDPAAGFLPNPARGAAMIAAGTVAVAAGAKLGASGGSQSAPAREVAPVTQQSQTNNNYNFSFQPILGDRRTQQRAIKAAVEGRA